MTCCRKAGNNAAAWCRKKYPKTKQILRILCKCITPFVYVSNVGTDINAACQYLINDDFWWGFLTLLFIVVPMQLIAYIYVYNVFKVTEKSVFEKCLLALPAIIFAPIVPIGILVWDVIVSIRSYDDDNDCDNDNNNDNTHNPVAASLEHVKLVEALAESYPQAALQMCITFQAVHGGNAIEVWQGLTIATSLMALAFDVCTCFLFDKAAISSNAAFFMFGLLAVTSRLVVCCVYSMMHISWWFIPFGTELGASIIVCSSIIGCRCSICVPLMVTEGHGDIQANIRYYLLPVLIAAYNSFTLSGIVVSTLNLVFAVVACFLDVPQPVAITAFTLAIVSCASNIIITFSPHFKGVRKDWLHINDNGESWLY